MRTQPSIEKVFHLVGLALAVVTIAIGLSRQSEQASSQIPI